jgi:hypothetical protein
MGRSVVVFYFVVFFVFGLTGGSAYKIRQMSVFHGHWVEGTYGQIAIIIAFLSWLIAAITILIQYDFYWAAISFVEACLGFAVARILREEFNYLLLMLAPLISVAFLGALWGFWYI